MNSIEKKLMQYADQHQGELFSLLTDLLKFDSQNFITSGREKDCAAYIKTLYLDLGLETQMYSPDEIEGITVHPGYLAGRGLTDRPNVSGVLYGESKDFDVMLAAHIDTMPVGDRAKWTVDPFGGEMKEGRIYGLGAGDNKFGIAGSYFALKVLQACGIKLKKTVVLTSYIDEEYGGGDGALAACLKYPCKVIANLDGGNYEMWVASLGGGGYRIDVKTNFMTDSAAPVTNALFKIKSEVEKLGKRRKAELHGNPLYKGTDMERSAYRLMEFTCGNFGSNLDTGFLNFVIYTTSKKEQIEKELTEIMEKLSPYFIKHDLTVSGFKPTTRFFGYHETKDLTGAVSAMRKAAGETSGMKVKTTGSCLSDLSLFLPYGSEESFNFGILRDFSLYGGAHQPDEYVECEQFLHHTKAMILFLIRYCGIASTNLEVENEKRI